MRSPLLFIHGAFSRASHFGPWADYFRRAGYRVIVPSLPGRDPPDNAALAELDLAAALAMLGEIVAGLDQPPVILGHGLGGLIAQHLAAAADRAGLVLVASWPGFSSLPRPRALLNSVPMLSGVTGGRSVQPDREAVRALALNALSVAERDEIAADMVPESGRLIRSVLPIFSRQTPEVIRSPVLVVSGAADRIVSDAASRRLAAFYGAEHIVVPGQGHWLIAGSLAESVAGAVLEWLERLHKGALVKPGDPSFRIAGDV
jgi:pimeloyl-ACP methyl ester carboxylesterase